MNKVLNTVAGVFTAMLVWSGCGPGPVASDAALVDPAGWSSQDTHQSEHHQSREWLNSGKEVHHVLAGFTS